MQYVLLDLSKQEVVCKSDVLPKRLFSESGLIEYDNGKLMNWEYTDDVEADKIKPTGKFTIFHADVNARKITVDPCLIYSDPEKVMIVTSTGQPAFCDRIVFSYASASARAACSEFLSHANIIGVTDEDRRLAIQDAEKKMKEYIGRTCIGQSSSWGRYRNYRVVDACIDDAVNETTKK